MNQKILIRCCLLLLLAANVAPAFAEQCVIILHGLGRTEKSMVRINEALERRDYRVWNKGYDSTSADVNTLAQAAINPAIAFCKGSDKTHFVTHSLGGILVRTYFQDKLFDGRVVMLGPPNQGSEVPDRLKEFQLFQKLLGPAGLELGTEKPNVLSVLKPIGGEIGIIAGNRSSDPWFSWLIPGSDDGKVSVQSTRLAEMQDFLEMPYGHTFMSFNPDVIDQILYFLQHGKFKR